MNLISFDIGIKNMAYCVMCFDLDYGLKSGLESRSTDSSSNAVKKLIIKDWNVLNLMEKEEPIAFCSCILASSVKKAKKQKKGDVKESKAIDLYLESASNSMSNSMSEPKSISSDLPSSPVGRICNKTAKYQKNGTTYCETHAKSNHEFMIPKKQWTQTALKKLKLDELLKLCDSMQILGESSSQKLLKKTVLEKMDFFFESKCYQLIVPRKDKSASSTDLITIGRNMKICLDQVPNLDQITHVIMENQISPIATRMKTVQGMLAQYFIMKYDGNNANSSQLNIECVSSVNKLKHFSSVSTVDTAVTDSTYKQHKIDGVYHCGKILEQNAQLESWKDSLKTKKKDDLADCFLQGIWYLRNKCLIELDNNYYVRST